MKEFLKKNKELVTIVGLVVLFVVFSLLFKNVDFNKNNGTSKIDEWYVQTKEHGVVVTVIAQTTCGHCQLFKPIMEEVHEENDFNLFWIEANELNNKDYTTLTKTYDISDYQGTPYTFITNNGEVVATHSGRMEKEDLVNFLVENGVINTEVSE